METILAFLALIGVLVWFHELGHFLFAKLFGVRVEGFSIGFGPVLLSKKWGETEYSISAVPLGGFVKLYGEEDAVDDPRAFSSKKNYQKIFIAFAGPLFNFLLAILVFSLIFVVGRPTPSYVLKEPLVGYVVENSPAQKLGLQEGDLLLEINGKKVSTWKDVEAAVLESILKKEWKVDILRNSQRVILSGKVDLSKAGSFGAEPYIAPIVGRVLPGSPAEQVGIKEGDEILEVDGQKVKSWYSAAYYIKSAKENVIRLKIRRDGQIFEKLVVPVKDKNTGIPIIGVSPRIEVVKVKEPLGKAVFESLEKTKDLTVLSLKAVWGLITGGLSVKTLGGPIAIAQLAGESAQQGLIAFLGMMAFISVQLAVFNLIPLPVLDGGLILLFLIESIRRKPLSPRFKENWQKVGFAIIIALSAFVILNDIVRLITGSRL